jgi:hypothetical protein
MFTWYHENSIEVNLSLQTAWNFHMSPNNWPKWMEEFESFDFEGVLKTGSNISAKVKNKPVRMLISVVEVIPYRECKCLIKTPLFTQEALSIYQEISSGTTRITLKFCIVSFLAPFMKTFFLKKAEKTHLKLVNAFAGVRSPPLFSQGQSGSIQAK